MVDHFMWKQNFKKVGINRGAIFYKSFFFNYGKEITFGEVI